MSVFLDALKGFFHRMLQLLWFGKKTITSSLSIYIKTNTGNTFSVDLDPKWDIKEVKEFVAPQLGLEPEEVKIIFAGKELSDQTTIAVSIKCRSWQNTAMCVARNAIWGSRVSCMQ